MLRVKFERNKIVIWDFTNGYANAYITIHPTPQQLQELHDDIGEVLQFVNPSGTTTGEVIHEACGTLHPDTQQCPPAKKLTGPVSTLSEDALGEAVSQADGVGSEESYPNGAKFEVNSTVQPLRHSEEYR